MSPVVTAVAPAREGEARPTCYNCVGVLSDSALRCSSCQSHVHLRCSGLLDYQLVRLSVTQSSYNCANCVRAKDMKGDSANYDTELAKIKELIAKEISIIDQQSDESIVNESQEDQNSGQNGNGNITPAVSKNAAICRFYLRKSCKHGKKGDNCNFTHPKLCFNFIKHGDQRGGCNKGANCQFTHPKLCQSALNRRVCTNKRCRFYHVTGTKFTEEPAPDRGNRDESEPQTRVLQRPYRNAVIQSTTRDPTQMAAPTQSRSPVPADRGQDANGPNSDFLGMQQQLKVMMDQLQMLITMVKPQLAHCHPSPPTMGWAPRQ